MEKCVSFWNGRERQELIEEVLTPIPAEDGNSTESTVIPLHLMMKDQFANYVVQKMLEIVDGEQRFVAELYKTAIVPVEKYTYGKHILAKVEKMLGLAPSEAGNAGNNGNTNGFTSGPIQGHTAIVEIIIITLIISIILLQVAQWPGITTSHNSHNSHNPHAHYYQPPSSCTTTATFPQSFPPPKSFQLHLCW